MKYIEVAASPRRTRISPVSMVWARSSRMISAISAARRCANSGTRASMPQVTMKSCRRTSLAKALEMIATGSAIIISPPTMAKVATALPIGVTGITSP